MWLSQNLGKLETVLKGRGLPFPLPRKNRICDLSCLNIHNPNMLKTKEQHGGKDLGRAGSLAGALLQPKGLEKLR